MYKKMEANQKMLCAVILGKNKQPNMEEALNAVQVLKKYTYNWKKIVIFWTTFNTELIKFRSVTLLLVGLGFPS